MKLKRQAYFFPKYFAQINTIASLQRVVKINPKKIKTLANKTIDSV